VHGGGVELTLDNDVGIGEAFFRVAHFVLEVVGNVGVAVGLVAELGGEQVGVQYRRAVFHGFADGQDGGQHFVVHLDEADGLFCNVGADCCDSGNGVAAVQDFAPGDGVVAQVLHRLRAKAEVGRVGLASIGHVRAGDDCHYAGQCLGF